MFDIEHILRHYDLCRVLLATKKLQSGAGYVDTAGYVDVPLNHPQPPSTTPNHPNFGQKLPYFSHFLASSDRIHVKKIYWMSR